MDRANYKKIRWILIVLFFLFLSTAGPVFFIYQNVKQLGQHSKALATAYHNQNFGQIQDEVTKTKSSLQKIDSALNFLIWLKAVPLIGGYYSDIKGFSGAGVYTLSVLGQIFSDLKPAEKELGFLGQPLAGQDRISQGIKILEKALPNLKKSEGDLTKAAKAVEKINIDKYPEDFKGVKLRSLLQTAKNFILGAQAATAQAFPALENIPQILGQDSSKNYLLLFQNDKEIRPTGGFITAYAFLTIEKGQITTTISDDIYRLDERLLATCRSKICPLTPPAPIVKYLPEVTGKPRSAWSMRDSNISPDLPTAAAEFERMYHLLGAGLPFDGIIYIDSQVVEELIEVTGPIEVLGTKYTSETDLRCHCPNVIYELESYAEIAAKGEQDRKAILGVLMQQILSRSVGADIEKIPQLIETIVRLANHKHVMFYLHDGKTQKAISDLNWTGEIKDFTGDYLHINDSNFAGGKSNLYVRQVVTQDIKLAKNKVVKRLSIEYQNPDPFHIWLNGINRDYVRIYVPKGSKLISSKGSDDPVNTSEDLGKTVFDGFIQIRPQNSRKLEFEYEIPYAPKDKYDILIQKQPGAKDFDYKIKINGRQVQDFKLDQDKEFQLNI